MEKNRKGITTIGLLIIAIVVVLIFISVAKMAWFIAIGPIFRNLIPLLIGGFVGYQIGKKK